jgi:hypothetical protein
MYSDIAPFAKHTATMFGCLVELFSRNTITPTCNYDKAAGVKGLNRGIARRTCYQCWEMKGGVSCLVQVLQGAVLSRRREF